MTLFSKKKKIILNSEQQRDNYIEKLDKAHVNYNITEEKESSFDSRIIYVISLNADDLKKVI